MIKRFSGAATALLIFIPPSAQAENTGTQILEPVVVTATRTETPISQVGSAITMVTAEDIAARKVYSVADALRVVPGLDVMQSGGLGRNTSIFLRGAKSEHTLVLIDGIEMNDPSSTAGAFDFGNLTVDSIERIEVLRGAQSSLYGSDAIGGVINIVTKKGEGRPRVQFTGEGGSYDTYKVGGGVSGGNQRLHGSLSASHFETGGFSSSDRRMGNRERDGHENTTVAARLGGRALDNLDLDWTLRYNDAWADIDNNFKPTDDPNHINASQQLATRGQSRLNLFDGIWEQTLGIAYSLIDRVYLNRKDSSHTTVFDSTRFAYTGDKIKANWQNNLNLHESYTLSFGIENEEESMLAETVSRKSANTTGYFLQNQIRLLDRSFTTAGIRYDDHNRFGGKMTWRANQVFAISETGTRLKGSWGTGFKSPTLYQLMAPALIELPFCAPPKGCPIGNPNVMPETSRGWDAGFDQNLGTDKASIGASYFNNRFNQLIDFDFIVGYKNVASASSEGVESFLEVRPLTDLTVRGAYTYTRTHDDSTGKRMFQRPTHKGSFDADYRFLDKAHLHLNIALVGDRDFSDFLSFPPGRKTLAGYALVNLAADYEFTKNLLLFARVDNVFDKAYQEVYGFGTSGAAGYAGFTFSYE